MTFDVIKKFDMFGKEIRFEYLKKHRYASILGGLLGIVLFSSVIVLAFMFGAEVWERKSPKTNISSSYLEKSRITLREYPLMVSFSKYDGSNIPEIFDTFDFTSMHAVIDENSQVSSFVTKYDTVKECDTNDYAENQREFITTIINENKEGKSLYKYCIVDNDFYFENYYITPSSANIQIDITLCEERENRVCSKKIKETTDDHMYIILWFNDSYPTPDKYKDPVKFYKSSESDELSIGLPLIKSLHFTNNIIISDEGWLLENIKEYHFVKLMKTDRSYTLKGAGNLLYSLILASPNLRSEISRSYTKIQDLCAQIGGIANFLFILLEILSSHYFDFKYKIYLFSNLHSNHDKNHQTKNFNDVSDLFPNDKNKLNEKGAIDISKFIYKIKEESSKNNLIGINEVQNIKITENKIGKKEEEERNFDNERIEEFNINQINTHKIQDSNKISNVINQADIENPQDTVKLKSLIDFKEVSTNLEDYESYYDYISSFICCNKQYKYILSKIVDSADSIMSIERYLRILKSLPSSNQTINKYI